MDSEEEYDEPVYIPSGTRRKSVFAEAYNPEDDESMDSEEEYDEPVYIPSGTRRKSVFAEAYNPEEDEGEDVKVVHPKTDEQRTRLQERVQSQLLFRTLDQ